MSEQLSLCNIDYMNCRKCFSLYLFLSFSLSLSLSLSFSLPLSLSFSLPLSVSLSLSLSLILSCHLFLSHCHTLTLLASIFHHHFLSLSLLLPLLSRTRTHTHTHNTHRRYELYHLRYVEDFSEAFFVGNRNQEWFRERYDPLKMHEQEVGNAVWAVKESAAVKKALLGKHY